MKEVTTPVKQIHPETLRECPEQTIMTLLEVARDLRNETIKEELFDMCSFFSSTECGTSYCIAGWVMAYQNKENVEDVAWKTEEFARSDRRNGVFGPLLSELFYNWGNDHSREAAADAIEAYVFQHATDPWFKYSQEVNYERSNG